MGRAVSDALARWTEEEREVENEYRRDVDFVRREWKTKVERLRGRTVVVSGGGLQGTFESYEMASEFAARFRVALTFVVGDYPAEGGDRVWT